MRALDSDWVRDNNMRNVTSSSYGLLKGTGKTEEGSRY